MKEDGGAALETGPFQLQGVAFFFGRAHVTGRASRRLTDCTEIVFALSSTTPVTSTRYRCHP